MRERPDASQTNKDSHLGSWRIQVGSLNSAVSQIEKIINLWPATIR